MSQIPPALPPRRSGQSQTSPIQSSTVSGSPNDDEFPYEKLSGDAFRLLKLPNRNGPRLYELKNYELYATSTPRYLALSYTWGSQESYAKLNINWKEFKLPTKNLEIASEYLIDRYPGEYLWTDAICINQGEKGKEEKASQIPRMKEIYTSTAKCVVWLGECLRGSRLDRALPQLPALLQRLQIYPLHLGFSEASFRQYGIPAPDSDLWEGLGDLLANEWFTRVWTFQESVLPETLEILCGTHVISTDDIAQLARILSAMPENGGLQFMADTVWKRLATIKACLIRINSVAAARRQRSALIPTQYTLLDLITQGTTWGVHDPCDRIYGILGLSLDHGLEEHLRPYNCKIPNALFLQFAKYWIQQDKHYQLFHFVPSTRFVSEDDEKQVDRPPEDQKPRPGKKLDLNDKKYRGPPLPSWCPSPLDTTQATSFWYTGYTAKYRAGIQPGRSRGPVRPILIEKDNIQVDGIQVEGFAVDTIHEVKKCPWERQDYRSNPELRAAGAQETLNWERSCLQISRSIYHRGNPSPQFFGQTQQENPFVRAAQGIASLRQSENPALRAAQGLAGMFLNAAANANTNHAPAFGLINSQDDVPDAHWQTLIANKDGNGNFYTGQGREAYRLTLMHVNSLAQLYPPCPQLSARQQALLQDFLQAFGFGAHGRAFVSTRHGRIGLAPKHTQPGDVVVILWNAGSPYVLRPVGNRNFKLVGEAYIHGLMYGEALVERQGVANEWFTLE